MAYQNIIELISCKDSTARKIFQHFEEKGRINRLLSRSEKRAILKWKVNRGQGMNVIKQVDKPIAIIPCLFNEINDNGIENINMMPVSSV